MLNKDIPTKQLKAIKILILDSDGVTIPRGTKIHQSQKSNSLKIHFETKVISDELAEIINQLRKKIYICISSGRNLTYLQTMYSKIIGKNTIIQAENGNINLIQGTIWQSYIHREAYFQKLTAIANDAAKLPIAGFEPKQFILTIHSKKELKKIYDIVKKHDPENQLKVMWNGEAFDIQDKNINKGKGLIKLLKKLGLKKNEAIAIGDRINDKELIKTANIGVSADIKSLPAEYWTEGKSLPGQQLAKYLLTKIKKQDLKKGGDNQ